MPLMKGSSRKAISENIKTESATKPRRQAIAIALSVARRIKKADGGALSDADQAAMMPETYANPFVRSAIDSMASLPQRAIENSQYSLDSGTYDPGPTLEAATLPMGTGAIAGVPVRGGEAVVGAGPIRAYHGSPHDFDAFSLDKIGTGEGAQAYGHGLYFAENPRVAQQYRDDLSNAISANGKRIMANNRVVGSTGNKSVDDMLMAHSGDVDAAIQDLKSHMEGLTPGQLKRAGHQADLDMLESLRGKVGVTNEGKMYEVQINADPEHFLDWDKPLSEQPQAIQDLYNAKIAKGLRTKEIGVNPNLGPLTDVIHPQGGSLGTFTQDQLPDVLTNPAKYVPATGQDFYRGLHEDAIRSGKAEPAKVKEAQVVQQLRQSGIPGIKYLDQGSRTVGEGSRNYVVFNDKLIDILRKYGLAGLPAAGAAALSQRNGDDKMASGGTVKHALNIARKANGGGVFSGYIPGTTGGRTDNKDIAVGSGSYVLPADVLSGLGEGNSHAGWASIANEYGLNSVPAKANGGPVGDPVPIVAASGEGVIPPEAIIAKHGDLDTGHKVLDAMVAHVRKKTIKKLRSLPGPKRN